MSDVTPRAGFSGQFGSVDGRPVLRQGGFGPALPVTAGERDAPVDAPDMIGGVPQRWWLSG